MKQVFNFSTWYRLLRLLPVLGVLWLPFLSQAQSANVVISQVYPAGGNSGATYNQDFVELFNRSTTAVNIGGWTIQYASATGIFGTSNNIYTLSSASIPAGGYYLIGIGTPTIGTGVGFTADQPAVGTIAINSGFAAAAGKVALASNATTVTYTAAGGFSPNVVDAVGYGSTATAYEGTVAPAPLNATAAIFRASSGCTDTNSNGADFASGTVSNPVRNSGTVGSVCTNPVLVTNPAALSFSATTGQVANTATYILSGYNLTGNATFTIGSNNAAVLVSTTGTVGSFAQTASVTATGGTLSQTITVQFTAPAAVGTTTATINNSNGSFSAPVAVTGTAIMAYTWNVSGSTLSNYSTASNWTPARTTLLDSDVLVFDGAATPTPNVLLDYATTQTIGQLRFINNVLATLSINDTRSLVLDGNLPGDDLIIGAGSIVTVTNTISAPVSTAGAGLNISLTNTETAAISGALIFAGYTGTNNGRHTLTLQNATTGSIQFLAGSRFQAASTYGTVSPFGATTANAGSVIFRNGARLEQFGGASPFGSSTSPAAIFEPASYFLSNTGNAPSLTGRTFGTLELAGSSSPTGSDLLTIQGDLIISSGTVNINLTGGVVLQGNVQVSNAARLSFTPVSASTVQLSGSTVQTLSSTSTNATPIVFGANAALQINNAAGVTLGIPITLPGTLPGTLQLTSGLLTTTAANSLTLAADATGGSNTSFVNGPVIRPVSAIGSYVFPIGKSISYRPITLNVSAQSGTAYYRAEQVEGNPGQNMATGSGLTRVSIFRSFTITPFASATAAANNGMVTQPTGFTGTATLSFGSNDGVTDPTATSFVVGKRADSNQPWSNSGRSGNTASALTSGAFTTFSDFVLASTDPNPNPNPLPVTLTSFTATRQASGAVQVRWATASEQRSAYFEVQRSLDGRAFGVVAKVAAQGTSTQAHTYASLDAQAPAPQLYYRLRQVDTDGTESFSPLVTIAATEATATLLLYPNPAHDYLTVVAGAGEAVQVLDLTGRVLQTTTLPASGQLLVDALPAGTYLLRVPLGGQPRVLRFTKE